MDTRLKWGMIALVLFALIYRWAFNDSIASNYEAPPGYSAPKSIALIEAEEKIAFEKALAEAQPKTEEVVKPVLEVKTAAIKQRKSPIKRKIAKMVSLKNKVKAKGRRQRI